MSLHDYETKAETRTNKCNQSYSLLKPLPQRAFSRFLTHAKRRVRFGFTSTNGDSELRVQSASQEVRPRQSGLSAVQGSYDRVPRLACAPIPDGDETFTCRGVRGPPCSRCAPRSGPVPKTIRALYARAAADNTFTAHYLSFLFTRHRNRLRAPGPTRSGADRCTLKQHYKPWPMLSLMSCDADCPRVVCDSERMIQRVQRSAEYCACADLLKKKGCAMI